MTQRRLSILDLAFFVLETAERPMNVGPLMVLAPPPQRGRRRFADVLRERMLRRPVGAPFDLRLAWPSLASFPALVTDDAFDLSRHVHRVRLPRPGTRSALLAKVCELHAQPLDRSRPLWAFYVIDGLAHGRVALYAKMHHGIVDGAGFVKIIARWLSASPGDKAVRAMWESIDEPTAARREDESLARSVGKLLRSGAGSARSAWSLAQLLWRQGRDTLGGGAGTPFPFVTTPGVLKAAPSARRSLACCTLPLARLKALGKTRDATINDMLLTVLDIALRRHLERLGAAPAAPLVADMPVALGAGGAGGNRIAMVQVPLGAPGLDPAARLEAIRGRTRSVKALLRGGMADAAMLHSVVTHGLPSLWEGAGWHGAPLLANLVVSNPFGFAEKRYLMGAPVEFVLPVSVVAPGQVLNVTAVNYEDNYQIAFLAIAEGVPHIDRLARDTVAAFESLAASLGGARPRRPAAKRTTRSARTSRGTKGGAP